MLSKLTRYIASQKCFQLWSWNKCNVCACAATTCV